MRTLELVEGRKYNIRIMQGAQVSAESRNIAAPHWNLANRIAFRFVFPYMFLFHLGALIGVLGTFGLGAVARAYRTAWRHLNSWAAVSIFHLNPGVVLHRPTGSTDTALDYIGNLCIVSIAVVVSIVWSGLDRRRPNYDVLHSWLRLIVRYSLASSLFVYGFGKVFLLQMAPIGGYKLVQPFGDISPMGVLWSFVGYSAPYQIFAGTAEVIAGSLLLFRRTTSLGSLISFGVLLNVVMLNICYDIPVKLFSINLLMAAVFLAAPDLTKLTKFFLFNQPVSGPNSSGPAFERPWLRITALVVKFAFVSIYLFQTIMSDYSGYRSFVANPPRPVLEGLYEVETFVQNGREAPPLTTDSTRWRRVVIYSPTAMQIQMMDESIRTYDARYSPTGDSVTLSASAIVSMLGPAPASGLVKGKKYKLACSRPDDDHIAMQGMLGADSLAVRMRRIDLSKFPLVSRGFHWIQESGFNP